jgi:hypothetical protein
MFKNKMQTYYTNTLVRHLEVVTDIGSTRDGGAGPDGAVNAAGGSSGFKSNALTMDNIVDITTGMVAEIGALRSVPDEKTQKLIIIDAFNLFIQKYPMNDDAMIRVVNLTLPYVINLIFLIKNNRGVVDCVTCAPRRMLKKKMTTNP